MAIQQNKSKKTTDTTTDTTNRTIYNLHILSWNIQSSNNVVGNKFDDNDFVELGSYLLEYTYN